MIAMVREIDAHTKMFNFILDSELTLTLLQNVRSKNPVRINISFQNHGLLSRMQTSRMQTLRIIKSLRESAESRT